MPKYKAFISYSHQDAKWAKWLLNALESYKIPKYLMARSGNTPDSLSPIFRDREELPASDSIQEEIFDALRASDNLIVICSPHSAKSERVQEEITEFKRLKNKRNILCFIVSGEPGSSDNTECFPPSILIGKDQEGYIEPLAVDARKGGDGKHNAMLKIAAGVLNVKLSDLIIRDSARRQKKYALAGIAAIAIISIISALAIEANIARKEADIARRKAQEELTQSNELIWFMGEEVLGSKFYNIDRLKIAEKLVDSLKGDNILEMSSELLIQRNHAIGQIAQLYENQNRFDEILDFLEPMIDDQITLLQSQDNIDPIVLAQIAYLIFLNADTYTEIGDHNKAQEILLIHRQIAESGHEKNPHNVYIISELSNSYIYSAEQDLEFNQDPVKALDEFTKGLELRLKAQSILSSRDDKNDLYAASDGGGYYHLSRAQEILHPLSKALHSRKTGHSIYRTSLSRGPKNETRRLMEARSTLWLAETEVLTGDTNAAITHFKSAIIRSQNLNKDLINPNYTAIEQSARARAFLAQTYVATDEYDSAKEVLDIAVNDSAELYSQEPSRTYRKSFYYNTHLAKALYDYAMDVDPASISSHLASILIAIEQSPEAYLTMIDAKNFRSQMLVLYGKTLEKNKQTDRAKKQWQKVIDLYDHKIDVIHPRTKSALMEAHMLLGNEARAKEIANLLWKQEYREAHFMTVIETLNPNLSGRLAISEAP